MRITLAASAVVGLSFVAGATRAAPPQTPAAALALYPKAAHDNGVDGHAAVACARDEHLRFTNCRVHYEDPPNWGFGQAAVALAQMTPPNPDVTAPPTPTAYVNYYFCAAPDFIDPNPLEPEHLYTDAEIDRRPSPEQIAAALPADAAASGASVLVVMNCTAEADGAVDHCRVGYAVPAGAPLAQAALSLAPLYHATIPTLDGKPTTQPIQIQVGLGPNPPLPPPPRPPSAQSMCLWRSGLPPLRPRPVVQSATEADVAAAYPMMAKILRRTGYALLVCRIEADGRVTNCAIEGETPKGQGFGAAAISLTQVIRFAPGDGQTDVTIPIHFSSQR